ncbi:MAG TPA: protein-L-isoaspartate(D-aspartate) O-methyltransferase [Burkholderiaceae bacterium]
MDPTPADRRTRMVSTQLESRGIRSQAVLRAMREVPRERFVEPGMEEFAYEDSPLPIAAGQTISQPYIVAAMIEAAEVAPGDTVLEVGAGSGYAAAVLSRIAGRVCAMERHDALAHAARERLAALGYSNVELRAGDGSTGWPEPLQFDAILVSATAPAVPPALQGQLAIGGRLVVPVGTRERQRLVKVTRTAAQAFDREEMEAVAFVPLIGAQGWAEDGHQAASNHVPGHARGHSLSQMLATAAQPLPELDDAAFGRLFDRLAGRRIVMLGEASHGTSEFYRARAAISRHLIAHHGFDIVAVEADWPDAAALDRHVRQRPAREQPRTPPFRRFPTWMWRNAEFAEFIAWMRQHNEGVASADARAGFYGLDLYNMSGSIEAVLAYLTRVDPQAARIAKERYGCLTPWQHDPATYGRAALHAGYAQCEQAVIAQCRELLARDLDDAAGDRDSFLDASQNARLIAAAERYYRVMYYGGATSWNLRDSHMFETLEHLLAFKGPRAKAIVWAHNSHIGDARHTEMGLLRDEHNIGQLARQRFGEQVALVGFGTHTGTVAAASDWDGEMEVKRVRPSRADSYERVFHEAGQPRCLLDLHDDRDGDALRQRLLAPRLQRYIGVIYRPETERWSHYAESSLPQQYDAFVWFDETRAVTPLAPPATTEHGVAETYPFGV